MFKKTNLFMSMVLGLAIVFATNLNAQRMKDANNFTSNPYAKKGEVSRAFTVESAGIILTHSSSFEIVASNSVSCNSGGLHADNSYWRSFNVSDDLIIDTVVIGVETAASGSGGVQPFGCRLYTSDPAFPTGVRTQVAEVFGDIPDQTLSLFAIPITAEIAAGSELVVEIYTPDGQTAGHSFFIGSNTAAETAPSYISAADCGLTDPATTGSIGFGNMRIVMYVAAHENIKAGLDYAVGPFVDFPANFALNGIYDIKAEVLNGTVAQTDVPVVFFVNDTPADTVFLSLDSLESDVVSFPWTASPVGEYNLKIKAFLATDTVPENDSIMADITVSSDDYGVTAFYGLPAGMLRIGHLYEINAIVENFGSAKTDVPVRLFENGTQVGSDVLVSLAGGEVDTIIFNWTPATTGDKTIEAQCFLTGDVNLANDSVTTTLTVGDTTDIAVTDIFIPDGRIKIGTEYVVEAEIENLGLTAIDVPVRLFEGGVQVGSDVLVSLSEGQTDTISFNWIPSTTGTLTLKVQSFLPNDGKPDNDSMTTDVAVYDTVGFIDDFEGGLGAWTITNNGGTVEWGIGLTDDYQMPATSAGNVMVCDVDAAGSGSTANSDATLTDPLNFSNYTTVNIEFDTHYNDYSTDADSCILFVSPDNGASWERVLTYAGSDVVAAHVTLDVSAQLAGASQALVRFRYIAPDWDWYWAVDNVEINPSGMIDVNDGNNVPKDYALHQNYPNPFNPTTTIKYDLKDAGKVSLKVYNILGQEVRTLVNTKQSSGSKSVMWDGKDNAGKMVSSGLYIYRLETGKFTKSHKMMLLK